MSPGAEGDNQMTVSLYLEVFVIVVIMVMVMIMVIRMMTATMMMNMMMLVCLTMTASPTLFRLLVLYILTKLGGTETEKSLNFIARKRRNTQMLKHTNIHLININNIVN